MYPLRDFLASNKFVNLISFLNSGWGWRAWDFVCWPFYRAIDCL